jgi:hypothetical protein
VLATFDCRKKQKLEAMFTQEKKGGNEREREREAHTHIYE